MFKVSPDINGLSEFKANPTIALPFRLALKAFRPLSSISKEIQVGNVEWISRKASFNS